MAAHGRLLSLACVYLFVSLARGETPPTDAHGDPSPKAVRFRLGTTKKPPLLTKADRRFTAFALAPNGKEAITADRNGDSIVWDANSGREIRRLESWDRPADRLVISPDGRWLAASLESGGPMGLWDLGTGRRKPAPNGGAARIGCAVFSPDGDSVALGDEDGVVHLCATKTGKVIRKFGLGDQAKVRTLAWSAEGETLVVGYIRGGLILYDPRSGRKRRDVKGRQQEEPTARSLAISADGRLLAATCLDGIVSVYETATGQEVQRTPAFLPYFVLCIAFAPDGRTLACGGGTDIGVKYYGARGQKWRRVGKPPDFSIRLWDILTNKEIQGLEGHERQIDNLAFSPDGARLFSQSADATVLCWDVAAATTRPLARSTELSAARRAELWTDLASRDAVRGQKAVGELIRTPDSALMLLGSKLTAARAIPRERIPTLLADLDSDEFTQREKATRELQQLGEATEPALRNALKNKPSLEVRKRIESLLEAIEERETSPQRLRTVRALQVLESIGTPKARQVLEGLSQGAADARLTQDAKAGVRRLDRRAAKP